MAAFKVHEDRPTYVQIPTPILNAVRERKLPLAAIGLYSMIDSYRNRKHGRCDPCLATLAADSGLSVPTIRKLNSALVDGKFMRIEEGRKPREAQRYILMYSPDWPVHDDVVSPERNLHSRSDSPVNSRESSRVTSRATASCTEQDEPNKQDEPNEKKRVAAKPPSPNWPKRKEKKDDPLNPHEFLEDWCHWYEQTFKIKPNWTRNQWAQYHQQFAKSLCLYGEEHMLAMMRSYWNYGEQKGYQITVDGFFRGQDGLYQRTKVRE